MKKSELRQIIREAISELVASRNIEELGGMIAGVKNRAEESAANRTSEGAQPPGSLGLEAVSGGRKDTNKEIADLLSRGKKVSSLAVGRIGDIVKVDQNTVYIKLSDRKTGVTSFNGGDRVAVQGPCGDGSFVVVNTGAWGKSGMQTLNTNKNVQKEGLGDWAGWGKKTPAQDTSEKKLEQAGFEYTHHFPSDSQDDPDEKMTIVMQKKIRYQTFSGEIEPDGTVSGEPVEVFLRNMKARGLREHSGENDMADPEEKREVAIGKQILQLCAQGEKGEETIADKGHPFRYGKSVSTYDQISALAEELIRMHGSSITENK